MIKLLKNKYYGLGLIAVIFSFMSCEPGIDNPGYEMMPDMGHSLAYEANVTDNYSYNTWDNESVVKYATLAYHHDPVKGTIPRGYLHEGIDESMSIPLNGHVPYYYGSSESERTRATAEITKNAYPISEKAIAEGKELFNFYCAICHGAKGDGNGDLVKDDDSPYPAMPANFMSDNLILASEGKYYHAIMRGKGVMQSFSDKLSYKERWSVIQYIRSMQAAKKGTSYSASNNGIEALRLASIEENK